MPEKYFDKFNIVTYANNSAVNILQRAVLTKDSINNPYLFYPFDISSGIRPDQLADSYYNDQYMSWLLYLSNDIIDPYYQWYLQPTEFNDYLKKKYSVGTTDILQQKVVFYRNNWYDQPGTIDVSTYDALANTLHKFWEPVYNGSPTLQGYSRVQQDWVINTNSIVRYTLAANGTYTNNELVDVVFGDVDDHTGRGQVVFANSSTVVIQHTSGTTLPAQANISISNTSYLYGRESGANVVFTAANSVANNIPDVETSYWSAVTVWDHETELNEHNKSIRILDTNYSLQVADQLATILK